MITELPLHIDIFALFIFLGAVQGIFLSYFFLNKFNRKIKANIFLGLLLITSSLLCFDILFSYTNFMIQVLFLVDATESINFVLGPLFYLYIIAKIDDSKIKKVVYHFLPAILYFLYAIPFYTSTIEERYNAYITQYHPELTYVQVPGGFFEDPLFVKAFVNELTILSILIYITLSAIALYKAQRNKSIKSNLNKEYRILWADIGIMTSILLIIISVKSYFTSDLGDYIIIIAICLFIYSISFKVIRDSLFFKTNSNSRKYEKSVLDEETKNNILLRIKEQIENKYYLSSTPSLPDLSKKINFSPNYVSQVINEKMNLSFLEMINKYRIEDAKAMILDKELNETIEGIAYSVGFNSKSTFHSAFKRFTGQTPSEFKNSKTTNN